MVSGYYTSKTVDNSVFRKVLPLKRTSTPMFLSGCFIFRKRILFNRKVLHGLFGTFGNLDHGHTENRSFKSIVKGSSTRLQYRQNRTSYPQQSLPLHRCSRCQSPSAPQGRCSCPGRPRRTEVPLHIS